MSKELLLVVDAVAAEKGVPESVILEAIEAALASAAKKRYPDQDVLTRVTVDPKDGSYETFRRWEVVADDVVMESPDRQVRLMDAIEESPEAEVGDRSEEHTSELQSLMRSSYAVFCLKKKKQRQQKTQAEKCEQRKNEKVT